MRYAKNKDIEIRVDLERPESVIQYRLLREHQWNMTPFQRADVQNHLDALRLVDMWLEHGFTN